MPTEDEATKGMSLNDAFCNLSITKFDGEDKTYSSSKWAQDIEDNAEVFGWTAQQKLVIARRSLTGTAELWLRSEKVFRTYEELKGALQKEFSDSVNAKEMHEWMAARKKHKDETYYQYMLTMKEMGKRAKFPDYIAIQYIIDGIVDSEVNKTILYGVITYPALKEKLSIYEKMKSRMKTNDVPERPRKQQSASVTSSSARRCFNCGEPNHVATMCPNGLKCFRCNKFGHIGAMCRSTGNMAATTAQSSVASASQGRRSMFVQAQSAPAEGARVSSEVGVAHGVSAVNEAEEESMVSERNAETSFSKCHRQQILTINGEACLQKCIKTVIIRGISVNSLLDTGSEVNLISLALFNNLQIAYEPRNTVLTGLGATKIRSVGKFDDYVEVDGYRYNVCFHIVEQGVIPYEMILGQPFLAGTIVVIGKGMIKVSPQAHDDSYLCFLSASTEEERYPTAIQQMVSMYKPLKVKEAPIKMKIILKDDIPVAQRPRRLALMEQEVVKRQVQEWLEQGVIRPSFSEYASPLVLVKKKDGSTRVCVDYRKINQKMVKDEYPLPIIEDHIDKLCQARVFSTLDLKNGFFHLPIEEDSIKYTAFVTSSPEGQFEFLRAPFGLSICPKYFMRFINIIFRDLIARGIVLIFIDDLIVLADDEQQATERLQEVLAVCADYGLDINWKKTQLLQTSVEYLGHVVSNGTVKPSPEKTKAVLRFPEPRGLKEVHSFLGLTSYFRKFVPDYALIARPLSELLKSGEFKFHDEERHSFDMLKSKLCSEPVLKIFDINLQTELHTDACKYGYAAILMQRDPSDFNMHPVHYFSKKTDDIQQRWSSYELEALAVVEGVKKFHKYLFGIPFIIVTDCEAFQKTLDKKDVSAKVARWIMDLQDYTYKVVHRTGDKMKHVDSLSRNVCIINSELHARVNHAQESDLTLRAIKEVLKQKNEYEDFYMERGIIYKGVEKRLVVPEVMDIEIIKNVHGLGHFGKRKMKDLIEKDYFMFDLDSKIEKTISTCLPCILANRKCGKKEGWLHPIDKGDSPLHTLHCDHLGPLEMTKKMYNYMLVVVDAYTKFVWIYPTKSVTTKETVEKMRLHQKDYGNPIRIVTDRGTAFTGREFEDYCQEEGIEHIKITTGVPRGNGQVERINKIIISVLSKMCIEEPTQWYKHVSKLQRVINSTYQRSIGMSPFRLLIGAELKMKGDVELVKLLEEDDRREFMEQRDELRRDAKAQILKIQEENRKTYNRKRKRGPVYKEGDLVAIQRTQFGNALKLKPKYFGPYIVTKAMDKDRYEVEKLASDAEGPKKTTTAVDGMKRWL